MAKKPANIKTTDPVRALGGILCNYPDWPEGHLLSLHVFKHELMAAAYKFYRVVGRAQGEAVMREKLAELGKMFPSAK